MKLEAKNKVSFIETVIHRNQNNVNVSFHRKPTNKYDFLHCISAHSEKTKTGMLIGFFLRAFRICDNEFLEEEKKYIIEVFFIFCILWVL